MEKLKLETIGTSATNHGYYVYKHISGGEIVYVGMGSGNRAWNSSRENPAHNDWMKKYLIWRDGSHNMELVYYADKKEALALEKELISKLRPLFNTMPERLVEQRREATANRIANGKNAAVSSVSVTKRNLQKTTCPTCGKEGGMMAMARWHGLDGSKCNS